MLENPIFFISLKTCSHSHINELLINSLRQKEFAGNKKGHGEEINPQLFTGQGTGACHKISILL